MEGIDENSNDELFQSPLAIEVLKWTKFSVKGYSYYQNYGYGPYQYNYNYNYGPYNRGGNNYPSYQVAYSYPNGPSYSYGMNPDGSYYNYYNGVPVNGMTSVPPTFKPQSRPRMMTPPSNNINGYPPQAASPGSSKNLPPLPRSAPRVVGSMPLSMITTTTPAPMLLLKSLKITGKKASSSSPPYSLQSLLIGRQDNSCKTT
ncbi:hypothetical protein AVEN_117067-1 [Araneus ventricosus]|uniref:Uncharacterized protein n=1 Tax=Araneus ventricosus TaxID=182803 RepID=A0A4Y2I162_ARAVE|nr:hypothetical protein AVEN_117067-1 [Araneus ventricosus]